jgi:hypothetical protein
MELKNVPLRDIAIDPLAKELATSDEAQHYLEYFKKAYSNQFTMKLCVLTVVPPALVTEMRPFVAPAGTVAWTESTFRTWNMAATPLNFSEVVPTK